MKSLLVVTTCDQVKYTKICEQSIPENNNIDIIFIDNASKDGTINYLTSKNRKVISKKNRTGVTDSCNLAYNIFKKNNYSSMLISNNDVIFNQISIERILKALNKYPLVCTLTSKKGAGYGEMQDVGKYYDVSEDIAKHPKKHNIILDLLVESEPIKMTKCYNGFFFGVNREIIQHEHSANHLFNPDLINLHQETDLYERMKTNGTFPYLCIDTFIFHYKAKTIGVYGKVDRNAIS